MTAIISLFPSFGPVSFRPFSALWDVLVRVGESNARARLLQHYALMSDAELANLGMTRADIVSLVYPHR